MRYFPVIALAFILCLFPGIGFAAFDDVTLTTDAVITVGGVDLNITGSSAVVESITVNASNFSFVLQSGSSIKVSSPTRRALSTNAATEFITTNVCSGFESTVGHASSGDSATITVTVLADTCAASGGGSGSSSSSSSSSSASQDDDTEDEMTDEEEEEELTEEEQQQRENLTDLIEQLRQQIAALLGEDTPSSCPRFTENHEQGDTGGQVADVQAFLRAQGHFTFPTNTGFYGPVTEAAVDAFQQAHAATVLTPLGLTGPTGNWYEATRNQANTLSGC